MRMCVEIYSAIGPGIAKRDAWTKGQNFGMDGQKLRKSRAIVRKVGICGNISALGGPHHHTYAAIIRS